jgi:MoaA/NifB/PqqE/SkfB family radical SAM enzyme
MLAELKKALTVKKHPGMASLSLPRLMWQAVPFGLSPSGRARPPLTVYWSVNSVCNLYCKMCDVGNPSPDSNFFKNLRIDGKLTEIRLDRFRSVVDEVAPYRPMISITSTEPLMYKPLGEAIAHARRRGLDVAVTTGGYTLPKRAAELVEAGLVRLNVSIDGPPELHNRIRGRKDSFQRSTEGIVLLKEAARRKGGRVEVLVNYTITNMNHHALVDTYDVLAPFPVDRINYTYMSYVTPEMASDHNRLWGQSYHATVNCLNDDTNPAAVDVPALHAQIQEVKARGGSRVCVLPEFSLRELERYFHEPATFMSGQRCMVNWFIAEIIASGEVIPYTRCYDIPLGNINEQPFMEIWNGEPMRAWRRDLRRESRFPACTRCDQCY